MILRVHLEAGGNPRGRVPGGARGSTAGEGWANVDRSLPNDAVSWVEPVKPSELASRRPGVRIANLIK